MPHRLHPQRRHLTVMLVLLGAFLLAPACAADEKGEFPDDWYFYGPKRPLALRAMEGEKAPELKVSDWIGQKPDAKTLKGNVLIVDFWATWCGPCRRAIPENIALVEKYADQGLVFVGVHDSQRGWESAPVLIKDKKISYPVGKDDDGQSAKAWRVPFWPTYFVIDHTGVVRAAGLQPGHLEDVVKKLLAEKKAADDTKK